MEWVDKTSKLDKLFQNMEKLSSKEVHVGFFDTQYGDDNDNLYVAQVAQWQEEGHIEGTKFAPPREFFRTAFRDAVTSTKYTTPLGRQIARVQANELTPQALCKNFGEGVKMELEYIIDNGEMFKPNSQEWSEHKVKMFGVYTSPLTYTGLMKESVKYKIRNKAQGGN